MATIKNDSLAFTTPTGSRRKWALQQFTPQQREQLCAYITALERATKYRLDIPDPVIEWVQSLPHHFANRLVAAGLIPLSLKPPTLLEFGRKWALSYSSLGPQEAAWHTAQALARRFGKDCPLSRITERDAVAWPAWLVSQKLAPYRHMQFARLMFGAAMRQRIVSRNPFAALHISRPPTTAPKQYIDHDIVDRLIRVANDPYARLILGLARYAGLRTPSEPFLLRWSDIEWEYTRFTVRSSKLSHGMPRGTYHERVVPLFTRLRPLLLAVHSLPECDDTGLIFPRHLPDLLWGRIRRWMKYANLKPFPKAWNSLRASCQTDLAEVHPLFQVCRWLGNSIPIADRHYLTTSTKTWSIAADETR